MQTGPALYSRPLLHPLLSLYKLNFYLCSQLLPPRQMVPSPHKRWCIPWHRNTLLQSTRLPSSRWCRVSPSHNSWRQPQLRLSLPRCQLVSLCTQSWNFPRSLRAEAPTYVPCAPKSLRMAIIYGDMKLSTQAPNPLEHSLRSRCRPWFLSVCSALLEPLEPVQKPWRFLLLLPRCLYRGPHQQLKRLGRTMPARCVGKLLGMFTT